MNTTRRNFLRACGAGALAPAQDGLIAGIERTVIWRGREGGTTWFHPRACRIPGGPVLMTCQSISGSDYFGPVHWSESTDLGLTWSEPRPIPGLGRRRLEDGFDEGVCDVVPEYHPRTRTVLAIGHNVYYKDGRLARPSERRWPIYVVRSASGEWSAPRKLPWDHPDTSAIYTCGCAQRVTLRGGDILVPLSFGPVERQDRAVCTVRCRFDGRELKVVASGNQLRLAVRRGLLEPSLAAFGGKYYMTIRAEDDRGYVSISDDGLHWAGKRPWCWDDGEPLTLSTTQQRWLPHSDGLFLVYTRKASENVNVMRWRAPLYVAEVDPRTLRLVRRSERIALPMSGDGVNDPIRVAHLGNFHTNPVTPEISLVTVGEVLLKTYRGDTLIARVRWSRPNRAV